MLDQESNEKFEQEIVDLVDTEQIEDDDNNIDKDKDNKNNNIKNVEAFLTKARLNFEKDLPQSNWHPPWPILPETRGHGLNRWDYFVCSTLGATTEWYLLPSIRPEHIQCARKIKRFLTGNLMAPVPSDPGTFEPFPGLEAHLLRAQIARITHSCWVCPSGFYEIDESEELDDVS